MKRSLQYVVYGVVVIVVAIFGMWTIVHFASEKTPDATTTPSSSEDAEEKYVNTIPLGSQVVKSQKEESFTLKTLNRIVQFNKLKLKIANKGNYNATVKIQKVGSERQLSVFLQGSKPNDIGLDVVAISTEQEPVVLSANTVYNVSLSCDKPFYVWNSSTPHEKHEHFILEFPRMTAANASSQGEYMSFLYGIFYKTLRPEAIATTPGSTNGDHEKCEPSGVKNVTTILKFTNLAESQNEERFILKTLDKILEFTGLKLNIARVGNYNVTVKIHRVLNDKPFSLSRQGSKTYDIDINYVAISTEQDPVVLLANTEYNVSLSCDKPFFVWNSSKAHDTYEHFILKFPRNTAVNASSQGEYMSFPYNILYKTLCSEAIVTDGTSTEHIETKNTTN